MADLYNGYSEDLAMAMAVYMLGFNTYIGFRNILEEQLVGGEDGRLKRIYEYAKKML